jgi:outer membrane protein OmpA-like peptidoglycan-associated protein
MKHFCSMILIAFSLTACSSSYFGEKQSVASKEVSREYVTPSTVTLTAAAGGVVGGVVGGATGGAIPVGAAVGAVLGSALGEYLLGHQGEVDQLQAIGVYFVYVGDNVMIIIPSQQLFVEYTSRFTHSAGSTLDLVRKLLAEMTKTSVKVAAFTPALHQNEADIRLTEHQAQEVESFLFKNRNAVDARFIYAVGYGSGHPVALKTDAVALQNLNYRIEITLTDLTESRIQM